MVDAQKFREIEHNHIFNEFNQLIRFDLIIIIIFIKIIIFRITRIGWKTIDFA